MTLVSEAIDLSCALVYSQLVERRRLDFEIMELFNLEIDSVLREELGNFCPEPARPFVLDEALS